MAKRGPIPGGTDDRDHLESAQAYLAGLHASTEEVALRIRQAMRRSPTTADLLQPALQAVQRIERDGRQAQAHITSAWADGQGRRWQHSAAAALIEEQK